MEEHAVVKIYELVCCKVLIARMLTDDENIFSQRSDEP